MKIKILCFCLFFSTSLFAQGFMQVANVVKLNGAVYINKEKIENGAEIANGMEINIPEKNDFIVIKFQNGHLVKFTGAVVKTLEIDPKEGKFQLVKGQAHIMAQPLTQGEKFSIQTKHASFAVRGTKFLIDVTTKNSRLLVAEGVVTAERDHSITEVRKDQELKVSSKKGKLKTVPATANKLSLAKKVFEEMQEP